MSKIRVGVLRGGPSSEYEVSLKTGANVLKYLPQNKYKAIDIFISKSGQWHLKGKVVEPHKIFPIIDVVFNAMHGEYGEDGEVQKILDAHSVSYNGSKMLASRMSIRKDFARDIVKQYGLRVAPGIVAKQGENISLIAKTAYQKIGPPFVIKPAGRGSSIGISFANTLSELTQAINKVFKHDKTIIIEKRLKGREVTCGVIENFRGENIYALPVTEIIPPAKKNYFDYESKYDGTTQEICPGRFDIKTRAAIQNIAKLAHHALGCRHYSRSDMIVSKDGVWFLETNTLPGLTSESLLPKSAEAIGCSFPQLLDHLTGLALNK